MSSADLVHRNGLGVGVVLFDEGRDLSTYLRHAAVDAAPDFALGDEGNETFDLIEPG
ncbi:hypothetical protein [Bradyrhizobium ottawaense]|uniref:hypothetical protein n=1 Tax=Bradyrhizobium ottawaense TaxID=931866 RepID=UPI003516E547